MNQQMIANESPAWIFFAWTSFIISTTVTVVGIYYMPTDLWIKGFLWMGLLFSVGSTFTLAKTIRDGFEQQKRRLVSDYELKKAV